MPRVFILVKGEYTRFEFIYEPVLPCVFPFIPFIPLASILNVEPAFKYLTPLKYELNSVCMIASIRVTADISGVVGSISAKTSFIVYMNGEAGGIRVPGTGSILSAVKVIFTEYLPPSKLFARNIAFISTEIFTIALCCVAAPYGSTISA